MGDAKSVQCSEELFGSFGHPGNNPANRVLVSPVSQRDNRWCAVAAVVIAVAGLGAGPARAREGPWCAFLSVGTGAIYEDDRCRGSAASPAPDPRGRGESSHATTHLRGY